MKLRYLSPRVLKNSPRLSSEAEMRLKWIDWYIGHGKNARLTCRHFGISPDTFYLWKNRFNSKNLLTLEDDKTTRRPLNVRKMTTSVDIINQVIEIRRKDMEKSKYEIQEELKRDGICIGTSTIQKIINRNNLLNTQHRQDLLRKRRFRHVKRLKAPKEVKKQYPGSLVQVDTKHLSILGQRHFIFTAIDTYTRIGYVYAYTTISSLSGEKFIERIITFFPFPIASIQTDNGSEYLGRFHQKCEELHIPHYFTDPMCPKQNGIVERFIQTLTYEYIHYQDDLTGEIDMLREKCLEFNEKYNGKRLHMSLGYKTPFEYLSESGLGANLVEEHVYVI